MYSLATDYRVMSPIGTTGRPLVVGLNEAMLGFSAPYFVVEALVHTVGPRAAEHLLTTGALVTAADALRWGLVDEVSASEEGAEEGEGRSGAALVAACLERACSVAQHLAEAVPPAAWYASKMAVRGSFVEGLLDRGYADVESTLQRVMDVDVQQRITVYR